jgi:hypothetical protein
MADRHQNLFTFFTIPQQPALAALFRAEYSTVRFLQTVQLKMVFTVPLLRTALSTSLL